MDEYVYIGGKPSRMGKLDEMLAALADYEANHARLDPVLEELKDDDGATPAP